MVPSSTKEEWWVVEERGKKEIEREKENEYS